MAIDLTLYEQTRQLILSGQVDSLDMSAGQKEVNTQLLMDSLKEGVVIDPEMFFDVGIDHFYRDPATFGTLLHVSAAYGIRSIIRKLLTEPEVDYLVQDYKKRYPSELAYEVARDFALGRLLMKKEMQQATKTNRIIFGPDAGKIIIRPKS